MIRKSDMIGHDYVNYYKGKRILITGGAGYLGSVIMTLLSSVACKITILDVVSSINPVPGSRADISLRQGDIRDKGVWREFLKDIDIIFHLAAQTSSRIANENPVTDAEVNLLPVAALIETCHKNGLRPSVIFSGTVTQAGITESRSVNETFIDRPFTVYDINKLAAEKYFQYYGRQMGGKAVTLRLANLYGPGPGSSSPDRGILNSMVKKALNGESLTIYGDGNFIRDYVYIDDVVKAFLMAGAAIDALNGNYYVIATGVGHTIKEMADIVRTEAARITGKEVKIDHVPPPPELSPIEFRNFIGDSSAFKNITGWKTDISLEGGVRKTVDYFLKKEMIRC